MPFFTGAGDDGMGAGSMAQGVGNGTIWSRISFGYLSVIVR